MTKLKTSSLTFLGFYVNSLLESHPGEMTFDELYQGIEHRTILEDLDARYPGEIDISPFGTLNDQRELLLSALIDVAGGLEGRERRKTGVERCGLNLLIAFIFEAIQRIE